VHAHVFLSVTEDSEKMAIETWMAWNFYGNDGLVTASWNCVEDLQTCKDLEDDLQNKGYSVQVLEKLFKQVLGFKL